MKRVKRVRKHRLLRPGEHHKVLVDLVTLLLSAWIAEGTMHVARTALVGVLF